MGRGKTTILLVCVLALSVMAGACSSGQTAVVATPAQPAQVRSSTATVAAPTTSATAALAPTEAAPEATEPVVDSATATQITLNGASLSVSGAGATVDGSTVTITAAGTYILSGSLADGQIVVDTKDQEAVQLVLNGVNIHSSTSAPLYIRSAEATVLILPEGAENTATDGDAYVLEDAASDEPNAAIFSKGDLTIAGNGSLTVNGNYNDGIASKDGLIITGGALTVNAADDGIRGKDYVILKAGRVTVKAQGDGLKSDNEEDAAKGYVTIEDGIVNITAGGDAITAQTNVTIAGGEFTLSAGGGSQARIDESLSAKGIKGVARVEITGGTFTIDSADDAIHSNNSIVIQGGTFDIATGDDAMHADAALEVNGGDIRITESYEGLESLALTINAGNIAIVASDDGLNGAGGNDGSGMNRGPGRGGGGGPGGRPGQDAFAASSNIYLHINGGYIVVDADGDGIDINGSVEMTDGVLIVNGPTQNMNGALDYDGSFKITGGFLVAAGSAGMAQAPDESSTQYSVLLNTSSVIQAGTLVRIQAKNGDDVLTFTPTKNYQSIAFSSAALTKGATYEVYFGGSSNGEVKDGLYQGGTYSAGNLAGSFTVNGVVTLLGSSRR